MPDLARTVLDRGSDAVSTVARRAADTARHRRQEMQILAGTAVFVVVVLLLGLAAFL